MPWSLRELKSPNGMPMLARGASDGGVLVVIAISAEGLARSAARQAVS
jgi:hypothetical protein